MWVLYIVWRSNPCRRYHSLANVFSHTVGSLFISLLGFFAMQKLFILINSHLFILSFMSLALGDISVKVSENFLRIVMVWRTIKWAVKYHIYGFIMWNIFLVPRCLPQTPHQPVIDLKSQAKKKKKKEKKPKNSCKNSFSYLGGFSDTFLRLQHWNGFYNRCMTNKIIFL